MWTAYILNWEIDCDSEWDELCGWDLSWRMRKLKSGWRKLIWYRSPSVRSASASPRWARAVLGWWYRSTHIAGSRIRRIFPAGLIAGDDLRSSAGAWSRIRPRRGRKVDMSRQLVVLTDFWPPLRRLILNQKYREIMVRDQKEVAEKSKMWACISGSFGAPNRSEIGEIWLWPKIFYLNPLLKNTLLTSNNNSSLVKTFQKRS